MGKAYWKGKLLMEPVAFTPFVCPHFCVSVVMQSFASWMAFPRELGAEYSVCYVFATSLTSAGDIHLPLSLQPINILKHLLWPKHYPKAYRE